MSNLPQRPNEHVLDTLAERFCIAILPPEWIVEAKKKDYGIDLTVELVKNTEVTGASFSIQLKGTDNLVVRKQKYIAHSCKTTTLNYFLRRTELVIYLVYDNKTKTGYWIWVQDFIKNDLEKGWEKKETQTIKIPLSNTFDKRAIQKIENRIMFHHKDTLLFNTIKDFRSPSFNVEYNFNNISNTIKIEPKSPEYRIQLDAKELFAFDSSPESQAAILELSKFSKTGSPVTIDGKFVKIDALLNKIIPQMVGEFDGFQFESFQLFSEPSNEKIPVKILYIDKDQKVVWEIPYIELSLFRAGTEEFALNNQQQLFPLKMELKVNTAQPSVTLSMYSELKGISAIQVNDFINHIEDLADVEQVKIIHLIDAIPIYIGEKPSQFFTQPLKPEFIEFIKHLAYIQEVLMQPIKMLEFARAEDLDLAKEVVKILRTGVSEDFFSMPNFEPKVKLGSFKKTLGDSFISNSPFWLRCEETDFQISLLENKLHLGHCVINLGNMRFTPETLKKLTTFSDNQFIDLKFETPKLRSVLKFSRWLLGDSEKK